MSVGFCGTPYILKRNICNVCGVLWDSIYTKKNHLQCLWDSVGLYILKKWSRLLEITFNHVCGVLWCLWCTVGFSHTQKKVMFQFRSIKCFLFPDKILYFVHIVIKLVFLKAKFVYFTDLIKLNLSDKIFNFIFWRCFHLELVNPWAI